MPLGREAPGAENACSSVPDGCDACSGGWMIVASPNDRQSCGVGGIMKLWMGKFDARIRGGAFARGLSLLVPKNPWFRGAAGSSKRGLKLEAVVAKSPPLALCDLLGAGLSLSALHPATPPSAPVPPVLPRPSASFVIATNLKISTAASCRSTTARPGSSSP